MDILFHTISMEPARWTSQRVSQKLSDLIPKIAGASFEKLEIYEPHLAAEDEEALLASLFKHGLDPVMLSSYLQISPGKTDNEKFAAEKGELIARVKRFGFHKVRLFPGGGVSPKDGDAIKVVAERISQIARELAGVQILLETHDGSIADEPAAIVAFVDQLHLPNVSLLYQPTIFKPEPALQQFAVQKHLIRHVHLQNRDADGKFSTLKEGVVPWDKILPQLDVDLTLEFVPSAICPVEKFDLEKSLSEAVAEADYAYTVSHR